MREETFRDRVRTEAKKRGLPEGDADRATDFYFRVRAFGHLDDIPHILDYASGGGGQMTEGVESPDGPQPIYTLPTPGVVAVSDAMARELAPWVRARRSELAPHAPGGELPFSSVASASEWVRTIARQGSPPPEGRTGTRPGLPYPNMDEHVMEWVPVKRGSPAYALAQDIASLATTTRFTPWDLLAYVILDRRPVLPTVETVVNVGPAGSGWARLPAGGGEVLGPSYVQLILHSPELTDTRLLDIHRAIRDAWGFVGKKPMTELQAAVLRVVDELGGVPTGRGQGEAFWDQVGERMEETTERPRTSRQATYMLWRKASEKLARLRSGKP